MKVRFWGVRGSIPSPGPHTVRAGGNTPCVEVMTPEKEIILLDAGTGIREAGLTLEGKSPLCIHLFLTHTHWDHIQGFPFFRPLFDAGNNITLHGRQEVGGSLEKALAGQMQYLYFPIQLESLAANIRFVPIEEGRIEVNDHTSVVARDFWHPGGIFSFRVERNGKALVYATDIEVDAKNEASALIEFAKGADLLIMDCQFTAEEYVLSRKGWGHGIPEAAIEVAKQAGIPKLAMFHHEPTHCDEFLEEMERLAQNNFPGAFLAREGMVVEL